MGIPLRVLIIEDSDDDVELLRQMLQRGGYALTCTQVQTEAALRAAIKRQAWDIVLADYRSCGKVSAAERQLRFLAMAIRNIDRLVKMINDVVDFSKIEAGKLPLRFSEVEVAVPRSV